MNWLRSGWRATAGLCLLLAIIHTWPLATAPGTLSRNDNGDTLLNEWAIAWIAHQLPRDPVHLFDGNIFYPAPWSLAFSEPLIVPALMGAPLAWLGGSAVLVFNLLLILGFALTAWAGATMVYEWTGDRTAGLLAGSTFAFNTHLLTRLAHIQGIHAWGLPMALLSADRLVVHARWRDAVWLAIWMAAMAYTSGYLVVFAAVMIFVVVLTRVTDWRQHTVRALSLFGAATIIAAVAILPVYLPYRHAARDLHMVRSLDDAALYSASLGGYLASAGRIHFSTWSGTFFKNAVDSFFPGFVVIGLAACAIYWSVRQTRNDDDRPRDPGLLRRRVLMLFAIAATGFVLSLGPKTPIYTWAYHAFPPMQGLRAAARFGNLFLLAMGALAGIGLAAARRRMSTRYAGAIVALFVIVANLEALRAPFFYTRFEGIPNIYSLLADEPGRVVLVEVPFYPPQAVFENAPYVLNSTAHWRPLMNGYSGYIPDSYRKFAAQFWYFPEPHAIEAIRQAGATHVIVHPSAFGNEVDEMWRKVGESPHLERIAIGPDAVLYKIK